MLFRSVGTFLLVSLVWVFFRAESVSEAVSYLWRTLTLADGAIPEVLTSKVEVALSILIMLFVEFLNRRRHHGLDFPGGALPLRWGFYYALLMIMFVAGSVDTGIEFIYFQF